MRTLFKYILFLLDRRYNFFLSVIRLIFCDGCGIVSGEYALFFLFIRKWASEFKLLQDLIHINRITNIIIFGLVNLLIECLVPAFHLIIDKLNNEFISGSCCELTVKLDRFFSTNWFASIESDGSQLGEKYFIFWASIEKH